MTMTMTMTITRSGRIGTAFAATLFLASCGGAPDGPDAPVGGGMSDPAGTAPSPVPRTAVAAKPTPAVTPDVAVLRTRRIAGVWRGASGGDETSASFGNDGSLSIEIRRDGAVVDAASGTWRWTAGNMLEGETSGAVGQLSRYSRWRAAFAGDDRMNVSGSAGAIVTLRRGRGPGR